jgi:uncharacterized protein with GYD domain
MATYLYQSAYTPEAWGAMIKSPQDRVAAVAPAIERFGGKIIAAYYAFGEYDFVAIVEMPDNVTAAAFSVSASAGGAVTKLRTTPLMTMREGLDAMRMAQKSTYRPPAAKSAAKKASRR